MALLQYILMTSTEQGPWVGSQALRVHLFNWQAPGRDKSAEVSWLPTVFFVGLLFTLAAADRRAWLPSHALCVFLRHSTVVCTTETGKKLLVFHGSFCDVYCLHWHQLSGSSLKSSNSLNTSVPVDGHLYKWKPQKSVAVLVLCFVGCTVSTGTSIINSVTR